MSTKRVKGAADAGHETHLLQKDELYLRLRLMVWGYRLIMLGVMAVGIFCIPAFPDVFTASGRLQTWSAYVVVFLVMQNVYNACAVGQFRVLELILSQFLSLLFSAGVVYLGVALYAHELFVPLWLLAVVALQMVLSFQWSLLSNRMYFRYRSKPRTLILSESDAEVELLCQSQYFRDKYDIVGISAPAEDDQALRKQLSLCERLFVVSIPTAQANNIAKLCVEMGIKGYFTPRLGHIIMSGAEHRVNFNFPLMCVQRAGERNAYRFIKRMFDIVCALAGLIVCSPIMLATAIAIYADDHGPVFYRQVRLTRDGRKFNILKFRSMSVNAEKDGVARLAGQNDSRVTRVGKFIRAYRIDELPQLINILLGDMSVVGPRPERPEIAAQYEQTLPEFALRLQVKAGLTGLAQVYGRYNTEPYHKLQMDLMYINEMSFLKDLQLILVTLKILFMKDSTQGVAQGNQTAQRSSSQSDSQAS